MVQAGDIFRNVTAAQASGQHNTISVRSAASAVYIEHLVLTSIQKASIITMYNTPHQIPDTHYRSDSVSDQVAASAQMTRHGLDTASRGALDNRWSIHWSGADGQHKRVLYQWCVSSCIITV